MIQNPSLITRIAIGKSIGLIVGIIGLIVVPLIAPQVTFMTRIGILFWYTTIGGIIGIFGIFTKHPALKLPLPWWFRSTLIGAWMNCVLTLIAYDKLHEILASIVGINNIFANPFWFVLEGAIVGLVIGYFTTRFGGQGVDIINKERYK